MFVLDTESLRGSGINLAAAGESFETAIEQFRAQIAGYGEPWGHDEIGMLVGMSFPVVGEYILECCLAVADECQLCGEDLTEVADETELTDEGLAVDFGQHHEELDGQWV